MRTTAIDDPVTRMSVNLLVCLTRGFMLLRFENKAERIEILHRVETWGPKKLVPISPITADSLWPSPDDSWSAFATPCLRHLVATLYVCACLEYVCWQLWACFCAHRLPTQPCSSAKRSDGKRLSQLRILQISAACSVIMQHSQNRLFRRFYEHE